jgi:hypothetical protein
MNKSRLWLLAILTIPGLFVKRKATLGRGHMLKPKQIMGFLKGKKGKPLSESMCTGLTAKAEI